MASPAALDARVLTRIVATVSSSLDLERVLRSIVRLLDEEAPVDASFVYLLEDGKLVLRAASRRFAHLVGVVALERGEGFVWWAAERRAPAVIREAALEDPRITVVPEIDDEPFQSLVALPVLGQDGELVGAISMHSVAPRELEDDEIELLLSVAALVAHALENARLYQQARRRVAELERLAELAQALARAETLDAAAAAVEAQAPALLRVPACRLVLGATAAGVELARAEEAGELAIPLVAHEELHGVLVAPAGADARLARALGSQAAIAVDKLRLVERLADGNRVRDFFDELQAGRVGEELARRASRLGVELDARWLVAFASPADESLQRELVRLAPGTLVDRRDGGLRALVRVPPQGAEALVGELRHLRRAAAAGAAVGLSGVCRGAAAIALGFDEARDALRGVEVLAPRPPVLAYDELGAYRYLLRLPLERRLRDVQRDGLRRVAAYDAQRRSSLLATLERFLARRGSVVAAAESLNVHPNTLRQRLRRIEQLSGLSLADEDWFSLELALKVVRLEEAAG